jgi:hypothetical protein
VRYVLLSAVDFYRVCKQPPVRLGSARKIALAYGARAAEMFGLQVSVALKERTPFVLAETGYIAFADRGRLQGVDGARVGLDFYVPRRQLQATLLFGTNGSTAFCSLIVAWDLASVWAALSVSAQAAKLFP